MKADDFLDYQRRASPAEMLGGPVQNPLRLYRRYHHKSELRLIGWIQIPFGWISRNQIVGLIVVNLADFLVHESFKRHLESSSTSCDCGNFP